MTKAAVERENLGEYVLMPTDLDIAFKQWWRSLDSAFLVNVRYPHERHGNAGKPSHFAKTSVKEDFLAFVDMNSQPNGRSADSTGATYYFLSKFSTIQAPKPGVSHFEHSLRRSLVGEFNRTQAEAGKQTCSNGSSHNWLKAERPKHEICPHKQDYCDTCAKANETIRSKQTTLNRLIQAAASTPEELKELESELPSCKDNLEKHREEANKSHDYFVEVTQKCTTQFKRIAELEAKETLDSDESEELSVLKLRFDLVISVDICDLICENRPLPAFLAFELLLPYSFPGIWEHVKNF